MTIYRANANELTKDQLISIINKQTEAMLEIESEITALKQREVVLIELINELSKVRLYNSANVFKGPMIRDKALVHDLVLKARKVMKDLDIEL